MDLHVLGIGMGYLGAALGVAMVVPQLLRTIRNRSMPGVSVLSWSLMALACTSWLLYGVRTDEVPQIPGNVLLISGSVVVALAAPSSRAIATRAALLAAAGAGLVALAVLASPAGIGFAAIAVALVSSTPQSVKSVLRRGAAVSAVAPLSWALRVASQACWLLYAFAVQDVRVVISAIVLLTNAAIVLVAESVPRRVPTAQPVPACEIAA